MEKLKKEKAKVKGAFTRARTRLFMTMEGGLSSRLQVMERLDHFTDAFDDVLKACEQLMTYYEESGDGTKLREISDELEAVERDFDMTERLVRGYLDESTLSPSKQTTTEPQTKKLRDEVNRQEKEIERITKDLEKTLEEYQKKLQQELEKDTAENKTPLSETFNTTTAPVLPLPKVTSTPINPQVSAAATQNIDSVGEIDFSQATLPSVSSAGSVAMGTSNIDGVDKVYVPQATLPPVSNAVSAATGTSVPNVMPVAADHQLTQSTSKLQLQKQCVTNTAACRTNSTMTQLGNDASILLTRVNIPKFSGNIKNYESWKAAFYACVDKAKATPEYKLLRLRECLQDDALRVVDNLGYSPAAYEAAKTRLERKYGGVRRALTLRLDEMNTFKPVREGNEKDLERLAELLDVIVVNLKDAGQDAELGSGSLYITLLRKLNKNLLAKYKQWINDKHQDETVEQLREFIDRESEFMTSASETISGVLKEPARKERSATGRTLLTQHETPIGEFKKKCQVCSKPHGLWACDDHKKMAVNRRWDIVKDHKVCFRCLGVGHFGPSCVRSRVCGLNACKSSHHRLLHDDTKGHQKPTRHGRGAHREDTHNYDGDRKSGTDRTYSTKNSSSVLDQRNQTSESKRPPR